MYHLIIIGLCLTLIIFIYFVQNQSKTQEKPQEKLSQMLSCSLTPLTVSVGEEIGITCYKNTDTKVQFIYDNTMLQKNLKSFTALKKGICYVKAYLEESRRYTRAESNLISIQIQDLPDTTQTVLHSIELTQQPVTSDQTEESIITQTSFFPDLSELNPGFSKLPKRYDVNVDNNAHIYNSDETPAENINLDENAENADNNENAENELEPNIQNYQNDQEIIQNDQSLNKIHQIDKNTVMLNSRCNCTKSLSKDIDCGCKSYNISVSPEIPSIMKIGDKQTFTVDTANVVSIPFIKMKSQLKGAIIAKKSKTDEYLFTIEAKKKSEGKLTIRLSGDDEYKFKSKEYSIKVLGLHPTLVWGISDFLYYISNNEITKTSNKVISQYNNYYLDLDDIVKIDIASTTFSKIIFNNNDLLKIINTNNETFITSNKDQTGNSIVTISCEETDYYNSREDSFIITVLNKRNPLIKPISDTFIVNKNTDIDIIDLISDYLDSGLNKAGLELSSLDILNGNSNDITISQNIINITEGEITLMIVLNVDLTKYKLIPYTLTILTN